MKRIFTFAIILMVLVACAAPQVQMPESAATNMHQASMPNPASVYCSNKEINSKFVLLPMAAKAEYVFFRMAALVTSGLITGESVVPQHKKAQHLPSWLRQPQQRVAA